MSEQIEQAVATTLAEAAYQFVSTEIAHIEQTLPDRLNAAEQQVQDWGHDAVNALHRVAAFIDQHRATPATPSTPVAPAQPAPAAVTTPAASAAPAPTETPAAAK